MKKSLSLALPIATCAFFITIQLFYDNTTYRIRESVDQAVTSSNFESVAGSKIWNDAKQYSTTKDIIFLRMFNLATPNRHSSFYALDYDPVKDKRFVNFKKDVFKKYPEAKERLFPVAAWITGVIFATLAFSLSTVIFFKSALLLKKFHINEGLRRVALILGVVGALSGMLNFIFNGADFSAPAIAGSLGILLFFAVMYFCATIGLVYVLTWLISWVLRGFMQPS